MKLPGAAGQPWIEFEVGINNTVFNIAIEHHFAGPSLIIHHLSTRRYREQTLQELGRVAPEPKSFESFLCDSMVLDALVNLTRSMVTKMKVSAPWTIQLRALWATIGTALTDASTSKLAGRTPDLPTSMLTVIEDDNMKHISHYQPLFSVMKIGVDVPSQNKDLLSHITRVLESALIRSLAGPAKLPEKATAQMKREMKLQHAADSVVAGLTSVLVLFESKFATFVAKKTELMPLLAQAIRSPRLPLLLDAAYKVIRWLGIGLKETIAAHGIFSRLIENTEDPAFVSRLGETEALLAEFEFDISSRTVQRLLVALNEDVEAYAADKAYNDANEDETVEPPEIAQEKLPALVSGVVEVLKTYNSDAPVAFITALAQYPEFSAEMLSESGYIDLFADALVTHRAAVLRSAPLFESFFLTPMLRQSGQSPRTPRTPRLSTPRAAVSYAAATPRHQQIATIAAFFRNTCFWERTAKSIEKLVHAYANDPSQAWTQEGQCLQVVIRTVLLILAFGPKDSLEDARKVGFFSRALVPVFDIWPFPELTQLEALDLYVQFLFVTDRALLYLDKEGLGGEGDLTSNASSAKDAGEDTDSESDDEDESASTSQYASRESLRSRFMRVYGSKHHNLGAGIDDWKKGIRNDANRINVTNFFPNIESWCSLATRYHEPGNEVPLTCLRIGWHMYGYDKRSDTLEMLNRLVLPLVPTYHPKLANVLHLPLRIRTGGKTTDFPIGKSLSDFDLPDTSELHTLCGTSTEYLSLLEYSATVVASSDGCDPTVLSSELILWMWWQMELGLDISSRPETYVRSKGSPKASKFDHRVAAMLHVWDIAMARVGNLPNCDISDPRLWYHWPFITCLFMSSKVVASSPGGVTKIPLVADQFAKRLTTSSGSLPLLEMFEGEVALDMMLRNCTLTSTKTIPGTWFFDACKTLISASASDLAGPEPKVVALILKHLGSDTTTETVASRLLHQLALLLLNFQLTRVALKPTDALHSNLTHFAADTEVRYFCTNWLLRLFIDLPTNAYQAPNTLARLAEAAMILILEPELHLAEMGLQLYERLFEAQPTLLTSKGPQQIRRIWDEPHFWMAMARSPAKLLRWMTIRQDSAVADEITGGQMSYIVAEYTHQLRYALENEEEWKKMITEETKTIGSSSWKRAHEMPKTRETSVEWIKRRVEQPKMDYSNDLWFPKLLKETPRKTQCAASFVDFGGKLSFTPKSPEEVIMQLIEAILECLKRSRSLQNASKRSALMPEYGFLLHGRSVGPRFSEAGTRRVAPSLQTDWTSTEYVIKPSSFERAAMRKSALQLPASKVFRLYEEYALSFSYARGDTRHLEYLSSVLPNLPIRFFPDGPVSKRERSKSEVAANLTSAINSDSKNDKLERMTVDLVCSLIASGHSIAVSAESGILKPLTRFMMRFTDCQSMDDAQKRCTDLPFVSMHLPRFLCSTAATVAKVTGIPLSALYSALAQQVSTAALKDAENRVNTDGLKSNLESLFALVRYDWKRFEAIVLPDLLRLIHIVSCEDFETDVHSNIDGRPTFDVVSRIASFFALYEPGDDRETPKSVNASDPKMTGAFFRTPKFNPDYQNIQEYPASNWSTDSSNSGSVQPTPAAKSKKGSANSPSLDIDEPAVRFITRSCLAKDNGRVDLRPSPQFPVYITKSLFVNLRHFIVEPSVANSSLDLIWKPTVLSPSSCPEPSD